MRWNAYILLLLFVVQYACKKPLEQTKSPSAEHKTDYQIDGVVNNFKANKVYLNKIVNQALIKYDSASVINNTFRFTGATKYPERIALSFESSTDYYVFILENASISIEIDPKKGNEPNISGSPLNNQAKKYTSQARDIFKKIEYLYPQFQKARLENNPEKLKVINQQMKNIEAEYREFSYNYIKNNKNSYLSAIILNDMSVQFTTDSTKLITHFNMLSEEVQLSPDAEQFKMNLKLH